MKVYTLLFTDALMGFNVTVLGNYSTSDLAIERMKLYNTAMGYGLLEEVFSEVWGAKFTCDRGDYEIVGSILDE